MFCYKCGCQLDDDSEFCYKCGAKLNDTVDVNNDNNIVQADYSEPDVVIVKKKSKLPVVIIILLLCIFIAVAVIVLIMLPKSGASKKYTDQIEIAENYFKDEDYERAIKAYEKAIEIDPNNKAAYIGLADVYLAMGEDEKAMEVLTSIDANLDDDSKKAIEDKISDVEDKTGLKSGNNSKKSDSKEKNKGEANKVSFSADAYNANTSVDGYYEAVSDVTVSLCSGFDNEGKALYSATTDENGSAYFDSVEEGDYTVIYEKDGFITTKENVAISEGSSVNQYMIQYSANNDVIAIVEWSGNQDIDLCFFNASTKERISYGNPVDGSGSFIYSDNKDNHYEMVYLRDINKSDVRSLYVVDAIAASNGQSSSMESDGIKVSVYKGDNCLYEKYANSSHSENIWYPFYVYDGDVYDADEYHNADESGYDWALLSKTGAESDKETVAENTDKTESVTGNWKEAYINKLNSLNITLDPWPEADESHIEHHPASDSVVEYWLVDIESDNVPELVVSCVTGGAGKWDSYLHIYKYIDGNVKDVDLLKNNYDYTGVYMDCVATDGKGKVYISFGTLFGLRGGGDETVTYDLKDNKFVNHQSEKWTSWSTVGDNDDYVNLYDHYFNDKVIESYEEHWYGNIYQDSYYYHYDSNGNLINEGEGLLDGEFYNEKIIIPKNGTVSKLSYSQLMNKLK